MELHPDEILGLPPNRIAMKQILERELDLLVAAVDGTTFGTYENGTQEWMVPTEVSASEAAVVLLDDAAFHVLDDTIRKCQSRMRRAYPKSEIGVEYVAHSDGHRRALLVTAS